MRAITRRRLSVGRGDRKEEAPADDAGGVAGRAWITAANGGPQLSRKDASRYLLAAA